MNAPVTDLTQFSALCRRALDEADGDVRQAVEIFSGWVAKDKMLRNSVVSAVFSLAGKSQISGHNRHDRATISKAADSGRASVEALATGMTRTLLDFPLIGGKKLRDANRDDLGAAIETYRKQADTNIHRAKWLTAIADMTPKQGVVSDVLDEDKALELWESAR